MYHTFVARHNIAYFLVYCDLLVTSTSFTRRDAFSHIEFHLLSTFLSVRISKDEVVILCAEYFAASGQKSNSLIFLLALLNCCLVCP